MKPYRFVIALILLGTLAGIGYSQRSIPDSTDFDFHLAGQMMSWSKFVGGGVVNVPLVWTGEASVSFDKEPVATQQGWAMRHPNGVTVIVLGDSDRAYELINENEGKTVRIFLSRIIKPNGVRGEGVFRFDFDAVKEEPTTVLPSTKSPSSK
ncbi:MAG: hypothetical protein U0795_06905 [Pirellulales bacterium]